ncbi:PC-esterase domain-containing protein 1B [Castor canadensis]|jgi:hypothetical protein|uniref:PC-esterase domain-containing protein 1B n=8 Tax=Castor canadensis TaxID=51338 RepID=A0A250YHX7_CASCN|nr:PC-esterase domain-containing protein 1B [Castor canadensis]XP_020040598.1 PC-esterase domain-containing protein 1B [Castor canadensis]XP_020040600.1 PC-esterase domain-containing protein 1B [Castor canadensis]
MVHLLTSEVQQLLHNKFVIILGDSVQRAVYKDLVLLLQKDCLLSLRQLKTKGELTFEQDKLVAGGTFGIMHNGIDYREVREFCSGHHLVRFYFITRVYSDYLEGILQELQSGEHAPDVIVMNSCLWDISRYGPDFWSSYLQNLESLFGRLDQVLPKSCLLVWNTAMPVSEKPRRGSNQPKGQPRAKPADVFKANFYSWEEARKHHFDVLDLNFHFRHFKKYLQDDGVHWNEYAHRKVSHLLLAHVADAWGVELPRRQCAPVGNLINYDPECKQTGQVVKRQPHGDQDLLAFPVPLPLPPPRPRALLPLPPPLPPPLPLPLLPTPQPLPIPLHQVRPPFPLYHHDSNFPSNRVFHSDQFAFQTDFAFGSQPSIPSFPSPCYQQGAPVVHRGFPRYLVEGPYMPWRGRPKRPKRRVPAHPQSRPQ